ncbi:MAG: ABC transporter ATP-binding protein/permease [Gammaproteobacteria bacterium]|nr:ABC transporter ATP-binding protein/permease [Gammaproteobacteria bacterium]
MHWQKTIFRYFWPFVTTDRLLTLLLAILSLAMIASNTVLIWMFGKAITQITSGDFTPLNRTLLVIAGIVLLNMLLQFFYSYNYQRATLRFVDRVRGALLSRIMLLSYPIQFKFHKGDLIARLSSDVDKLLTYVFNIPLNLVANSVVLIVYSSMIFWINWQLALIAVMMAPLFFLSQYFVGPKTGRASRQFTREKANLMSIEEQTLANLRGISSFNSESIVREKHRKQFEVARAWAMKVRMINMFYNTIFTVLLYFVALVIIISGISGIQSGRLELGVFVSFLVYIRFLTNPVRSIARMPIQMHANRASAERVMEIMNMQPGVVETGAKNTLKVTDGGITFHEVSFTYPNADKPVFSHLSAAINGGESVALVGPSGSGKSTFAGLLMRFHDPQEGAISIDSVDIKSVSLASLRDQISIVWQEPFIVNGSIRENLQLARPDAVNEQIVDACQASFAWEFIEQLADGLDTIIGVNGVNLSAGQIQRLAIAQAFLRDTPILILDEASSALDSHSDKMVVEALHRLRHNRTTLIIAHRFSSIRSANRILYFNGNGTVTIGIHDELISKHAGYTQAVNWQTSRA